MVTFHKKLSAKNCFFADNFFNSQFHLYTNDKIIILYSFLSKLNTDTS